MSTCLRSSLSSCVSGEHLSAVVLGIDSAVLCGESLLKALLVCSLLRLSFMLLAVEEVVVVSLFELLELFLRASFLQSLHVFALVHSQSESLELLEFRPQLAALS